MPRIRRLIPTDPTATMDDVWDAIEANQRMDEEAEDRADDRRKEDRDDMDIGDVE